MLAIRTVRRPGEHAVKSSQVNPGLRHQGSKLSHEIQRLEDDVGSAIPKAFVALMGQAFSIIGNVLSIKKRTQVMKIKLYKMTVVAAANAMILAFLVVMTAGSNSAFAQAVPIDPSLEVFRIRCQIDADLNPANGLIEPKVQIQAKARADLLDGAAIGFLVENISRPIAPLPPNVVNTVIELGSASADWDTFPDPGDLTPVTVVAGDFVESNPDPVTGELIGEMIKVTAQVTVTGQTVTGTGHCADKTSAQFKQQTKNVCTLKKFNRGKCKSGDILPDGTIMP